MKIHSIALACDTSDVKNFAEWLVCKLPDVRITVSSDTAAYINGVRTSNNRIIEDYFDEFNGTFPYIPDGRPEESRPAIEHYWDGEFWIARSPDADFYELGFGYTPEQATLVLMMVLEKRKFWSLEPCEPNFEDIFEHRLLERKLCEQGVYTTAQLRSLSRIQAKLLDVALNAKGRILHWNRSS